MRGLIYIDETLIGEADFLVIDESMGAIGGDLIPTENYKSYRKAIQKLYFDKGIANIDDFKFKLLVNDGNLAAAGGIGITDAVDFNEIYVEASGIDLSQLNNPR